MKKMTRLLALLIAFSSITISSNAQDFDVPSDITLEAKEDYAKYEKQVIAATDWLEATPVKKNDDKRKRVSAFIIQWISGSPIVNIELGSNSIKITDKNPDLLVMLMAGYSRYALQNEYEKDKQKCFTAAMKSVISLYSKGGDLKKNKLIEKAVNAEKEGKLSDWVSANLVAK